MLTFGVTAQMWEWWFGWHNTESARYELWFPTTNCGSRRPPVRGAGGGPQRGPDPDRPAASVT
ncbi:DAPG hydrolase family protein [Streptomyces sp. NPDC002742]|uniref:DAPG hydrolase family protein n=1 Tax=Streptomyces sp. NPDC002742 TaxID=3364663 RepID=UPI0036AE9EEB